MSKKKSIPKLSHSVTENIEMFIEQAELSSQSAKNTVEDLMILSNEFLKTLTTQSTKDYVFWKIVDEYIIKKYKRPNHLRNIYCKLEPKYFIVYQLLREDELMYVGKTIDIHKRLSSHLKDKDFNKVLLTRCETEKEQDTLEQTLIERFRPKLNKALNINLVDDSLIIPEFKDISDFHLDFFNISSLPFRLQQKDHIWLGNGFVSLSKLMNKPYWK